MIVNRSLLKQIDETRYLSADNAWRYRTILRFFYLQYEKMKYWMLKEEIYDELINHSEFNNYSIDMLKQDLDSLVVWKNLIPIQDTSRVATVEEFKNKQFRYQLSDYSIEIERMSIRLENLSVENASLEVSLLDRLRDDIAKFPQMIGENDKTVGSWWSELNNNFKRVNQNYQDYLGTFYSIRAEEMMKTKEFLIYKDKFVDYLRDFIKSLHYNVNAIESILREIRREEEKIVIEKIYNHEISIPRLDVEVKEEDILDNIKGKWDNLKNWFLGTGSMESEASKLFEITNNIIRKITRYAVRISESRNNATNRKEEYKKLAELFLLCDEISDAHKLSSLAFGISSPRHIKGDYVRETDSINSGIFEENPYKYTIRPRSRIYREKIKKTPISYHSEEKDKMKEKIIKDREKEKDLMESFIVDNLLAFEDLPEIRKSERIILLRWLDKGLSNNKRMAKTEYGRVYKVVFPKNNKKIILKCEDGNLLMPAFVFDFKEK